MKKFLLIGCIVIAGQACSTTQPMSVTANPDPTTSTSGTASSAKFTDRMPRKSTDTATLPTDTARIKREAVPR
ncbi:MAG TPA: hypothetical protein VGM24_06495 [Puia sp.]